MKFTNEPLEKVVRYIRVSTPEQNASRQRINDNKIEEENTIVGYMTQMRMV